MTPAARRITILSAATTLLLALGACSRSQPEAQPKPVTVEQAAPAPAAKPLTPAELQATLMRAVFQEGFRPASGDALAELPDPDKQGARMRMVLEPLSVAKLPGGETALVLNGQLAGNDGKADSGHASPGLLSLYLLRDNGGNWEVVKRHENIAALGSSGRVGEARWVKQTNGQLLLAVEGGGTWQGYTVTTLDLFDPSADRVGTLVREQIRVGSGNQGGCGPTTDECWDIASRWHLAPSTSGAKYDDLVMLFTGYHEKAAAAKAPEAAEEELPAAEGEDQEKPSVVAEEKSVKRERKTVAVGARYVFDKGSYRLKSGQNPVPGV